MTELLEQAIAKLRMLPEREQEAIVSRLLAEIEAEQAWESRFVATTDDQWNRLTQMVHQDIQDGEIMPLDEVFPAQP
ncbi:MAG TPA: hypothetical protein IGS52_00395 [Oscillatoriaceae cyanobacterium M33_DOE_052]|uniref:Uncharacterized protein n=1 Tax=Planktothricoides sp. SpSt-374 TaxID=2282167 RepID=A0A7C3ZJH2_9CYAN|nr:hypothetical protein [Oscillatoriaceae cyanobacterium M33_DOE_052]